MFFIHESEIPKDRHKDITYGHIIVVSRPQKKEQECTRLTVGGNLVDYPWDVATLTADLTTAKLLFNSIISTLGVEFVMIDCKIFYLMTPMKHPKFMCLQMSLISNEIIEKYNLKEKVDDRSCVYVRIKQGIQYTPGLRRHKWHPIAFSLVVGNFGVKTIGLLHVKHLKNLLEKYYEVTVDWKGELFCSIKLDWDYKSCTIDLPMPHYIPKVLTHFQHSLPSRPQHAPYKCVPIQYGKKVQLDLTDKTSPGTPLLPALPSKNQVHSTKCWHTSLLLTCYRPNPGCCPQYHCIATIQWHPSCDGCLPQCPRLHCYPSLATICYCASDRSSLDTDRSYLSEPGAKSRAAAYFYLTKKTIQIFTTALSSFSLPSSNTS
ncbi:hypothetical protein ACHAW6_002199 [Cyclotella cf. meneghiniana]